MWLTLMFFFFLKSCLNLKDTEAWVHIQVGNDFDGYYLEQHSEQVYCYVITMCLKYYFCCDINHFYLC